MALTPIGWNTPRAIVTLQDNTSSALASGAAALCATATDDNSSNLDLIQGLELQVTFTVAPTANSLVEAYFVPAMDGTNYADQSNTSPQANMYLGGFQVAAVTTAQRLVIPWALLLPYLGKIWLRNQTGQSMPAGWIVRGVSFKEASG